VSNVWTEFAGGIAPAAASAHAGNSYAPSDSPSSTSEADPSAAASGSDNNNGGWAPGQEGALDVLMLELELGQVGACDTPRERRGKRM